MTTLIAAPTRIQRRRVKGWRMPQGAVNIGRPGPWGNPFQINDYTGLKRVPAVVDEGAAWEYEGRISADGAVHPFQCPDGQIINCTVYYMTREEIVETYRRALTGDLTPSMRSALPSGRFLTYTVEDVRRELAGKTLACWCSLDQACHGDVLLSIANGDVR